MIIEELIRLGSIIDEGGCAEADILKIITDISGDTVKNFYRNVCVVEIPEGEKEPEIYWTTFVTDLEAEKKKKESRVDMDAALGCPISIPSGGNPLKPQGRYGVPVFPCWDQHLIDFQESVDEVHEFLQNRIARSSNLLLSDSQVKRICNQIHQSTKQRLKDSKSKQLGIIVLAQCVDNGFYFYQANRTKTSFNFKSRLRPGHYIQPNHAKILASSLEARIEEGSEMGKREEGVCTISGQKGIIISAYCKAWPWATKTWTCPIACAGDDTLLIEQIGLSLSSYRCLTIGAGIFNRIKKTIRHFILQELFSPTGNQPGRAIAHKRKSNDLDTIFGAAFVLRLENLKYTDQEKLDLATDLLWMINPSQGRSANTDADRQLETVIGFEGIIPDNFDKNEFRITLVYFSGDTSKGDIHLRAYIQDVIPSRVKELKEKTHKVRSLAGELFRLIQFSEKSTEYHLTCYNSVPYLLARGYGGMHLWSQFEETLHHRRLYLKRVTANSATRMSSLITQFPKSRFDLAEEAIFWLSCKEFIHQCNLGLEDVPLEEEMPMRPWRVLLSMIEKEPIENLVYQNVTELGFGCGALVRQFTGLYWTATKTGDEGKDYLKHRVLTFGADLTPDMIWKSALKQMFEVAKRYPGIQGIFEAIYQTRVGVTLTECDRLQDDLRKHRDEFLTAFWAGYSLQGYDRPKKDHSTGKKEEVNHE